MKVYIVKTPMKALKVYSSFQKATQEMLRLFTAIESQGDCFERNVPTLKDFQDHRKGFRSVRQSYTDTFFFNREKKLYIQLSEKDVI